MASYWWRWWRLNLVKSADLLRKSGPEEQLSRADTTVMPLTTRLSLQGAYNGAARWVAIIGLEQLP